MTTTVHVPGPGWGFIRRGARHADGFEPRFGDMLSMFRWAVGAAPERVAIHYFDGAITYAELDRLSDVFAAWLRGRGVGAGDRVALYLQNVPQFVIALVAAWKVGACGVSINPMNRARELRLLLEDSGARVLVVQRDLYADVAREVLAGFGDVVPVVTSVRAFQTRDDPRLMPGDDVPPVVGVADLDAILATRDDVTGDFATSAAPGDIAMLVYTSGTTGVPKGAMVTHRNLAVDSDTWRDWMGLPDGSPNLCVAPLFHITGLGGNLGYSFAIAAPLILTLRFHPEVVAEAMQEHRAAFVVGAITVFIAMMNSPGVRREHFASMKLLYTGGAPVAASVAAAFQEKFGLSVHNSYGMTETTSIVVTVPPGVQTPTDANGAYSIGIPTFGVDIYIAGESGEVLGPDQTGEIMTRGAQVVPGYWQKPAETAASFKDGFLKSGDVGYMNADGWLYIVDRKKDMISASGYKVWPKEVEDVIYSHPAIREAAVIGVPDDYRGETVKAVVSLKPGATLAADELIAFCKERMAAYKYPRIVAFIDELPKTPTGKILRRELRVESDDVKAKRHVEAAEREAARVDFAGSLREIRKVGVIGAGTMGGGIAMNFAAIGLPVTIVDTDDAALARGLGIVRRNWEASAAKGKLTDAVVAERLACLAGTTRFEDLADCDLIVEAVFEDMALKKSVMARLGAIAKPGAILASNTSTLDVDGIALASGRPADVLGTHFFSPANVMRLLEVVRGARTAPDVLATVMDVARRIGKTAVVSGVCYGFIGNRMAEPYMRENEAMLLEGAQPIEIDSAIEDTTRVGMAMGPCRMLDMAGIDVGAKTLIELEKAGGLPADPAYRVVCRTLFAQGRNGQKTGAGYYRYDGRKPLPDPETTRLCEELAARHGIARRTDLGPDEIVERLMLPLINEGVRILEEGIAARPGDIDVVWTAGYGFPIPQGGPMWLADRWGLERVVKRLDHYAATRGNPYGYWTVAPLLRTLVAENRRLCDWRPEA